MAIASAKQENGWVKVYDERGSLLFTKSGTLRGYTSDNVSIQEGDWVKTYDERGSLLFSK